jgi:hypothetical protein
LDGWRTADGAGFADIEGDGEDFDELTPFVCMPGGTGRLILDVMFDCTAVTTGAIVDLNAPSRSRRQADKDVKCLVSAYLEYPLVSTISNHLLDRVKKRQGSSGWLSMSRCGRFALRRMTSLFLGEESAIDLWDWLERCHSNHTRYMFNVRQERVL